MNRDQAKHCIHVVSFNSFNRPLRSELLRCHLRKLRLTESKVSTVPQCVRNRVRFLAPCRAQVFLGHSASSPYTVTEAEAQRCWLSPKSHSKNQAGESQNQSLEFSAGKDSCTRLVYPATQCGNALCTILGRWECSFIQVAPNTGTHCFPRQLSLPLGRLTQACPHLEHNQSQYN